MNWLIVIWSMSSSACLTLAMINLAIWFKGRTDVVRLLFALAAVSVAALSIFELGMMLAQTPAQYARWVRWVHLPIFASVISIAIFVRLYLQSGKVWLLYCVCAATLAALLLNFPVTPNLNFAQITGLRHVNVFGAVASISVAEGLVSNRMRIGEIASILLLIFVSHASISAWLRGDQKSRRRVLLIGGSVILFVILGAGHVALIHAGRLNLPYMISLTFLIPVVAMGYELAGDVVRSGHLARDFETSRIQQERKQAEREQLRHRSELAHLARVAMLGELSGSLAHELNQPLTAILSNAQAAQQFLAQDPANLDEVKAILEDIVGEDRRAREVIRRLRLLFRKGEIQQESLDLNELVIEVLRMMNGDLVHHNVAVRTELTAALPPVTVDRVQIQQVLINLMTNASDAMADNDPGDRQLCLRTQPDSHSGVELCVIDNGSGVPKGQMEQIFEPFHSNKPSGMGLGLAISRTILAAHGARLWASNNIDRGASFHVGFPNNHAGAK